MGSSDSNVWHQVHAQREDGVAAMFLIRDVVPRPDQPKIFVVELPYPVTDLSGQPDAAGYRRLGAFQDQWLEPACAALGWTFVAWKCEDGSFFLYLYGSGDPEALLDKLAPFDGELGFFNDLDADWSEYAALRELVEQAEAAEGDRAHVHGDGCDHDHGDHDHGEDCDHDHGDHDHDEECGHDHHVHGEGCDHDHGDHDHDRSPDRIAAPHAIEVIDLTGDTPTRTWVRPAGTALDGDGDGDGDGGNDNNGDDGAARPDVLEVTAETGRTLRRRRGAAPSTVDASRATAPRRRTDAADDPMPRRRSRAPTPRLATADAPSRSRAKRSAQPTITSTTSTPRAATAGRRARAGSAQATGNAPATSVRNSLGRGAQRAEIPATSARNRPGRGARRAEIAATSARNSPARNARRPEVAATSARTRPGRSARRPEVAATSARTRPGRDARRPEVAARSTSATHVRPRPGAAKRPAKRTAAAAPRAARPRAARDTDGPVSRSPRVSAAAPAGRRSTTRTRPVQRAASTSAAPVRAPRRRSRRTR